MGGDISVERVTVKQAHELNAERDRRIIKALVKERDVALAENSRLRAAVDAAYRASKGER